ncbi:MAG: hypothetical protein JO353_06765 [Phycisphaerae bacterium]|nr:hypothetical protein [Phycisphaerae bacterium]
MFDLQSLESRRLLSATTLVIGQVDDAIRLNDGTTAHTGLADRVVYLDANDNGTLDSGELSTTTDLSGNFKLHVSAGSDTIRLVERSGWSVAGIDSITLDVSSSSTTLSAGTFTTRMTHPTRVDVLALYTPAARAGLDSRQMAAEVRSLFLQANQVYANSDTNTILNVVAITSTQYRESGSVDTDLDHLGSGDGILSNVVTLRKVDRADLVTLFTSGDRTLGADIGVAYEYDPTDSTPRENGFNVVALQHDTVDNDAFTLAHEIGHNLGAGHDQPDNDGPGVTSYAYGYHYIGNNGRLYQDVMDYSNGIVLPFFSTPDFSWAGEPIGNAKHADNARIIRESAPAVAKYY